MGGDRNSRSAVASIYPPEATETLVVADDHVDARLWATDLLGQAERAYNSSAILLTNSAGLAHETLTGIDHILPTPRPGIVGGR